MNQEELKVHVNELARLLLLPWQYAVYREECTKFQQALQNYLHFLENQQQRTKANHESLKPVVSLKDDWSCGKIEGNSDWNQNLFDGLYQFLKDKPVYEAHSLLDIQPPEIYQRKT